MSNRTAMRKKASRSFFRILSLTLAVLLLLALMAGCAQEPVDKELVLATTTSVHDSGLLETLIPVFEKDTGMTVKIVAQGTGQAIKTAQEGNADVLLVHDKRSEEKFVSEGYGVKRVELMYNYFVLVGPKEDPAGIGGMQDQDAGKALQQIMDAGAAFISRGDDSGTHKKELKLWDAQGIKPAGDWYVSAGKGMGAVLSMASEKKAYTLTDKATYLSMKDKLDLAIVLENAKDLLNQYSVIAVNEANVKGVNQQGAGRFMEWLTADKALQMIGEYGKDKYGENLFTVNYKK